MNFKNIHLQDGQIVCFISDLHLGSPDPEAGRKREMELIRLLEELEGRLAALFLIGDIFDYWFEYKNVIPKGGTRLLGKLAQFCDRGIEVHFFYGNHDAWCLDYFSKEIGMQVHPHWAVFNIQQQKFLIGHGDGLGKGDRGYKILKSVFRNPFSRFLYASLHPRIAYLLAHNFSRKSRQLQENKSTDKDFQGIPENLLSFMETFLQSENIDYFVFGHYHAAHLEKLQFPIDKPDRSTTYVNSGDWLYHRDFVTFDGKNIEVVSDFSGH